MREETLRGDRGVANKSFQSAERTQESQQRRDEMRLVAFSAHTVNVATGVGALEQAAILRLVACVGIIRRYSTGAGNIHVGNGAELANEG